MTTSGTSSFNYNRDQIIRAAARKLGVFAAGETPDAQTVTDFSDALNIMVKAWDASGIHIWTESEALLFLQPNQIYYTLGGTTTDHCADITTTPANITTLSAAASSGATSVTVTSASGMAVAGQFGVTLASGTIFWTTISSISSTTITLAAALTGAANSAAQVFNYATANAILRPLRVPMGRSYNYSSTIDIPLIPLSRMDYRNLPNKTNTGVATQYFYDPRGGANTQGIIWVWPAPYDATYGIKFTWYRPLQDFTSAANTPDLPNEWIDALIWNLAKKMAPEYDCTPQRYQMIVSEAATSVDLATGWDREPESIYFGVNFSQR